MSDELASRSCKVSILDEVESVTDEESDLRAAQKIRAILDQKEVCKMPVNIQCATES